MPGEALPGEALPEEALQPGQAVIVLEGEALLVLLLQSRMMRLMIK